MEDTILDDTDPTEKAQAKAILQNVIAMDAMVQCMSKMDNFHRVLLSMKEDVDWPTQKAWKTWQSIQNHYQPMDTTTSRGLTMALQKTKLKKDIVIGHGLMQLLSIAKWRNLLNSQLPVYNGDRQAPPDLSNLLPEGTDLDPDEWLTHHKSIPAFPHRNASVSSNRSSFGSKRYF